MYICMHAVNKVHALTTPLPPPSSPPPTEVIGAIISVLLIWVLTGVLVYEAILRVINRNYEINADVMLIISCAGVFLNVL